jgi:hypothetical protein
VKEMFIGVELLSPALIAVVFGPSRLSSSKKADRLCASPCWQHRKSDMAGDEDRRRTPAADAEDRPTTYDYLILQAGRRGADRRASLGKIAKPHGGDSRTRVLFRGERRLARPGLVWSTSLQANNGTHSMLTRSMRQKSQR